MAYSVELTDRAARDLRLLFLVIHADESETAARWLNGMERAIESLGESPNRCPIAIESRPRMVVRQLLYGRRPHVYRILFRVSARERSVTVLHIRHGARLQAGPHDLGLI